MQRFGKFTFPFLILFFTIIFNSIGISDDAVEWKQNLEKDYQKVLKAKRMKLERHRGLVSKWHEREHLQDLIDFYEDAVAKGNADANVYYGLGYAYFTKAEAYQNEDALNRAVNNFSRSITLDPSSILARMTLAEAYRLQDKYPQAIEQYESCLELDNKYYKAYYEIGEIYRLQKKYDEAISEYKKAIEIKKKWVPPFYSIGLINLDKNDLKKAKIAFEYVIKTEKKHSLAHFKLGQVYAKEGEFPETFREYEIGAKYGPPTAEVLYELGKIFANMDKKRYAQTQLQKAIEVDPNYAPAHFQLGEVYYDQGDTVKALEHYQTAIRLDPDLEGYFSRQFDKVKPTVSIDEARILLDKSLLIDPNNALTYFKYAQLEFKASNNSGAIEHYEKAIEIDENFVDAYVPLGNRYYEINERDKAAQFYRKAIQLAPNLKNAFFERAQEAFSQSDFNSAAENFDKHSLVKPQDGLTQYWLGRCYDKLEDFDKSLEYYLKAVEFEPTQVEPAAGWFQATLIELARNYQRREDTHKMMEVLDKLIEINPENVQAHYLAGYGYIDLKQPDLAISEFTKVVELESSIHYKSSIYLLDDESKNLDAHYQLGMLYEDSGKIEQAIYHYESAIEIEPEFVKPYLRVGKIYLDRDDKDNVIRVYSKGLQIEPDHPQEQYDLAAIYEEREELMKAIEHFGLANKFKPDKYDWHFRYARLLDRYTRGLNVIASDEAIFEKYAAMAVQEYTETIKLNYAYAPAFYYRGLFCREYKQIGDTLYRYSQIAEDFKQAIGLDPKMIDAYQQLGMTYVNIDDRSKAESIFKKALKIDPTYKGMNLQLGLIAEWREEYNDAIEYYKAEIQNDPESVRAYQQLGYLYSKHTIELNKAKNTLEKALELDPKDVKTLLNYGNTLYNMGETGSAIEKFELAVQIEPKNLTANYNLAQMYEYAEKRQLAIARWQKFLELNPPAQWRMEALKHLEKLKK